MYNHCCRFLVFRAFVEKSLCGNVLSADGADPAHGIVFRARHGEPGGGSNYEFPKAMLLSVFK